MPKPDARLSQSTQTRWVCFVRRLLVQPSSALKKAASSLLPASSLLAWTNHKHRISKKRAAAILTGLGSSWHAFDTSGSIPLVRAAIPRNLQEGWLLAQDMTAVLGSAVQVRTGSEPDALVWLESEAWSCAITPDLWLELFKSGSPVLEGRYSTSLTREVCRVVRPARKTRRKATACVSSLHKKLSRAHMRSNGRP